uniref:Gamma-tubulin complex component n=1 Tax=Pseudonaja textilis TaxID=8673 RepID=A0A670YTI2_PSETE
MMHELLLALRGYPGGLFVGGGLQVSPEPPPFLHPSEAALLARVCRLGALYVRLQEFIEQFAEHAQPPLPPPAAPPQELLASPPGIYLRAFCTGLDAVLQPYRQALLGLEQEFLADPHLTISYVNYSLDQFQLLFPSLMTVVEQIKIQKIHGCQILETVYKYGRGGLPPVRQALEKVLAMCHAVLYKQLSAWMLHGLLLDHHEEFFIRQGPSLGLTPAQPEDDDDDLGIGGLTGKQLRELQDMRLIEEENMLAPSPKQFSLRMEMLPSYIPARVAEKILFVGESVQMFESQNVTLAKKGSILKNQEETFAAELHRLKQQPLFNLMDFEAVVDWIRSAVAEHLWKLMVEEADLIGQLKLPPAFFSPSCWLASFSDPSQNRETPSRELSPHESPTSGWAALGLSYKVQWPLHILFTPAVLEKYNVVFKYLLSVRRVQAELQHCWALQMRCKCLESRRTDAIKWRLRHHMTFLVDNLQYYLQVDVLESQFSQLLQQINSTRDFESIRLAHDHFLSNLLAQSFILLKPASSFSVGPLSWTLGLRLLRCLRFPLQGFSCQSSLLFKILSSVHNHQINSDLAQLLLRSASQSGGCSSSPPPFQRNQWGTPGQRPCQALRLPYPTWGKRQKSSCPLPPWSFMVVICPCITKCTHLCPICFLPLNPFSFLAAWGSND